MEAIAKQIHKILLKTKTTISVAESCTGGLLSSTLVSLPGSSKYFICGVIAYNNKAKEKILHIPAELIAGNGAVSEETALAMARNVRRLAKSCFGIGITGIAGPTGGRQGKPVGTVFIAVSGKDRTVCEKFRFKGNRASIRKKAALKSLVLLRKFMGSDPVLKIKLK